MIKHLPGGAALKARSLPLSSILINKGHRVCSRPRAKFPFGRISFRICGRWEGRERERVVSEPAVYRADSLCSEEIRGRVSASDAFARVVLIYFVYSRAWWQRGFDGLCWKATYSAEIRNLAGWPQGLHRSRILANARGKPKFIKKPSRLCLGEQRRIGYYGETGYPRARTRCK